MKHQISDLPPWLAQIHHELIVPRRKRIQQHAFMQAMRNGSAEPKDAQGYFSGLMWHLLDFGKHVGHLMGKRDPAVADFLAGRSEDKDGDTAILGRIVEAFGGPVPANLAATRGECTPPQYHDCHQRKCNLS